MQKLACKIMNIFFWILISGIGFDIQKKIKFDCKWKYIMKDTFIFLLSDHFEVKRSLENVFFKTPI